MTPGFVAAVMFGAFGALIVLRVPVSFALGLACLPIFILDERLTPVVLITGWGRLVDPVRLRESGVDLMLVKPFRLERVIAIVGDALRLRPGG